MNLSLQEFIAPLIVSGKVAAAASVAVFLLGALAAWQMTVRNVRGRLLIETAMLLPLVLPPTVVGFFLLVAIGRNSPFGRFFELASGEPLVFTWWAAALAAVVVSFPLVYQTLKAGFASVNRDLTDAARTFGAGEWHLFRYITLPLAKRSLAGAYILGLARSLGEFGATLMVAGNIPGQTQTVPTAIYIAVDSGNMPLAWSWTAATAVISFAALFWIQRQAGNKDDRPNIPGT